MQAQARVEQRSERSHGPPHVPPGIILVVIRFN